MSAKELLSHLRDLGVDLWADDDELRFIAPKGVLTEELRAQINELRAEIVALVRVPPASASPEPFGAEEPVPGTGTVAARTPTEKTLAEIWTRVLSREEMGVHDNFFESGGDSVSATRVMSQVREALQVELSLRELFEFPTIAELARRIDETPESERKLSSSCLQGISPSELLPQNLDMLSDEEVSKALADLLARGELPDVEETNS